LEILVKGKNYPYSEAVTAFNQDLHQVVSQVTTSLLQREYGMGQRLQIVTYLPKNNLKFYLLTTTCFFITFGSV